ncbi:MAG: response regulator [Balneolaceae bacterium]|nr:MAG: response regulator [Balneolaceae bacterium]
MKEEKRLREVRVFVIDSDVLMRQILASMLRKKEEVNLTCSTGFCGVDSIMPKIKEQKPDVIMLGVKSSDSDEMNLFYQLRKEFPDVFVVLLTPLNREGAATALQGLKDGAIDYVTKPDKRIGLILANRHFQKRLLPLIKSIPKLNCERINKPLSVSSSRATTQGFSAGRSRMTPTSTELIVIGSCMGGVTSLYKLISQLPESLPVPVVIVQHMPKIYTEELSLELDRLTPLNVREARVNSVLLPGQIYVAPGGYHTVIKNDSTRNRICLHRGPREHRSRPSIDVLLRSAIQAYGGRVLSIFLSGKGNDGILGAKMVMKHGGNVLLESEESSLIWDMPKRISSLGNGINAVSADSLASVIVKLLKSDSQQKKYRIPQ